MAHNRAVVKTKGSVAFAKSGRSANQHARELGLKVTYISNLMTGQRRPSKAVRERIEDLHGIPPDAWDLPIEYEPAAVQAGLLAGLSAGEPRPTPLPPALPPVPAPAEVTATDVRREAQALLGQVQGFRAKVQDDPVLTLSEKAKVLGQCAQTLSLLYRMTGAAADIPVSKILKLPAWATLERTIVTALEAHPEAMRALGEALAAAGVEA